MIPTPRGRTFRLNLGRIDAPVRLAVAAYLHTRPHLQGPVLLLKPRLRRRSHHTPAHHPRPDQTRRQRLHLAVKLHVLPLPLAGIPTVIPTPRGAGVAATFHFNFVRQDGVIALHVSSNFHDRPNDRCSVFRFDQRCRCDIDRLAIDYPGPKQTVRRKRLDCSIKLRVRPNGVAAPPILLIVALDLNAAGQNGTICLLYPFNIRRSAYFGHTFVLVQPGVCSHGDAAAADNPGPYTTGRHRLDSSLKLDKRSITRLTGVPRITRVSRRSRHISVPFHTHLSGQKRSVGLHLVKNIGARADSQGAENQGVGIPKNPNAGQGKSMSILCVENAF